MRLKPLKLGFILLASWSSAIQAIGGQRDTHGCLTGAGYSWCELGAQCIRSWELADCFRHQTGTKFAQKFSKFAQDRGQQAAANGISGIDNNFSITAPSPNYSAAAATICDPEHNFWDNISARAQTNVIESCFTQAAPPTPPVQVNLPDYAQPPKAQPASDPTVSFTHKTRKAVPIKVSPIAEPDLDQLTTIPASSSSLNANSSGQWCDTMRRNIDPAEFDLTDPQDFSDFCNPAAIATPDFF